MLAWLPLPRHILERDSCGVARHNLQFRSVTHSIGQPRDNAFRPEEIDVAEEAPSNSCRAVEDHESDGDPDVEPCVARRMLVYQPQEERSRRNVLQHKEFVDNVSERCETAKVHPEQHTPSAHAVLDHRHHLQLNRDKVRPHPLGEEEAAMDCDADEQRACNPSMKPVETLIRRTHEHANKVDLSSQHDNERHLHDRDPRRSET